MQTRQRMLKSDKYHVECDSLSDNSSYVFRNPVNFGYIKILCKKKTKKVLTLTCSLDETAQKTISEKP